MSVVVIFALRHALDSARQDAGITQTWFNMGAPSTPDLIYQNAGNDYMKFQLNVDESKDVRKCVAFYNKLNL